MKVYFHLSLDGFSNCYVVTNEKTKQAIIIDPGKMSPEILMNIERDEYTLSAALLTHNHKSHYTGLRTLQKIYSPEVYAADYEIVGAYTQLLKGDGMLNVAGLNVAFMSVPGHTSDSMVYRIGSLLFTGDSLTAGILGKTSNSYAEKILRTNILTKVLSQNDSLTIMPGHGPPSSVEAEKKYNLMNDDFIFSDR